MGKQTKYKDGGVSAVFLKWLCLMVALMVVAMVCIPLGQRSVVDGTDSSGMTDLPDSWEAYLDALQPEETGAPDQEALVSDEDAVLNFLLIGQDRRPGEERARSDAMILCTIHKDSKRVTMTSILRDLYVPIPGYQDNRINAAYILGGIRLLKETVETNFDIRIDGCVEVDFEQFAEIVDILGGVTIDLRADEAQMVSAEAGGHLKEGQCHLNGAQALAYARIRSLDADGDFSRTNRQRKLLHAMLVACGKADLKTMLSVLGDILPEITTDMSRLKIFGYGLELFPLLPELTVVSRYLPGEGTYSIQRIRNMSVLVADMDAARELLEETLRGQ